MSHNVNPDSTKCLATSVSISNDEAEFWTVRSVVQVELFSWLMLFRTMKWWRKMFVRILISSLRMD